MKGILMKSWKAKAIAESSLDREWQTRRLSGLKEINQDPDKWDLYVHSADDEERWWFSTELKDDSRTCVVKSRYQVGEVVYIKEAHRYIQNDGDPYDFGVQYRWDSQVKWWRDNANLMDYPIDEKWRSPMFLKAKFARYFIQITDVRPERLQEITEEDAVAEGSQCVIWHGEHAMQYERQMPVSTYRAGYANLWDSINPKYPWSGNWWIWRYEFRKVGRLEV